MAKSKWNDDKVLNMVRKKVMRRLELAGSHVESAARLLAPVDTNRLRDSITYATKSKQSAMGPKALAGDQISASNDDLEVKIGTNVEYAPYMEFGTNRIGAKPYLRPALLENQTAIITILNRG